MSAEKKKPSSSGAIVRDKVACIRATGADLVICNDGGCTMNIAGGCRREGVEVQFKHIIEMVDAAMARRTSAPEGVAS